MKKLLLFRLSVLTLITITFLASWKLENEASVFIMLWNVVFTTAYVIAEAVHVFDKAKSQS